MPETLENSDVIVEDGGDDVRMVLNKDKKTFNSLPAHLQWRQGLDEDHIFPEEYEMIRELRDEFGDLIADWSDKLVVYFLFARRCELEPTRKLIKAYTSMLQEIGWLHRRPTLDDAPMLKTGLIMFKNGAVDKFDRLVVFFNVKHLQPGQFTKTENLLSLVYETNLIADTVSVRYLRNGFSQVVELSGFGWRNLDTSQDGKDLLKAMQGLFPRRIRQFWVVNGGYLLRMVMGVAKLLLPAKMIERVDTVYTTKLKENIDSKWIPKEYGGDCEMTLEGMMKELRQYDAQFNVTNERSS